MFLESFRITSLAVSQIFILGAIGFFLIKRNILKEMGLDALSRLVIEVTLPILIFCQLVKDFSFSLYPDWWIFPLISIGVTAAGFLVGALLSVFIEGPQNKLQFLGLVGFQNSGYLPLALVAALLSKEKMDTMFIYVFLFLLGFNLIIWSFGVHILTFARTKKFELGSLFSPPVAATIFSLLFIYSGLSKSVPVFIFKPLKMAGDCTLPLALMVVGGSLAQIRLKHIDKKAMFFMLLAKLIILPLLGVWLINVFKLPELIGLLIIMQLSMPSAVSLTVIIRHYKKEDLIISQGIFFSHILSIITLPLFLSLYFSITMLK